MLKFAANYHTVVHVEVITESLVVFPSFPFLCCIIHSFNFFQTISTMPIRSPRRKSSPKKAGDTRAASRSPSTAVASRTAVVSEEEVGSSCSSNSSQQQPQEAEVDNSILVDPADTKVDEPAPPKFVYQHELDGNKAMRDLQGNCILHTLPAQIDMRFSGELYTKEITSYLDQVLQNDPTQKVTVLLDVRPGRGWPNAPAPQLMGLIRHFVTNIYTQYPDALHKFILFPIPRAAIMLYKVAIKPLLMGHPQLKEVMELVPGPGLGMNSPAPLDKLAAFVSPDNLKFMEDHRLKSFYDKAPKAKFAVSSQASSSPSKGRAAGSSVSSMSTSRSSLFATSKSLVAQISNIPANITLFFVLILQDVSVCFLMVVMMMWEGFPFQKNSATARPTKQERSEKSQPSMAQESSNDQ